MGAARQRERGVSIPERLLGGPKWTQGHVRLCLVLGSQEETSKQQMKLLLGPQFPHKSVSVKQSPGQVRSPGISWEATLAKEKGYRTKEGSHQTVAQTDERLSSGQKWPGPWSIRCLDLGVGGTSRGASPDPKEEADPEEEREAVCQAHISPPDGGPLEG